MFANADNQERKKAHKHKQNFLVTARVGGGSPDRVGGGGVSRPVARGQKFMCCVRNPRNINIFVRAPGRGFGYPAGRIGDRGDRAKCLCAKCMLMCLFRSRGQTQTNARKLPFAAGQVQKTVPGRVRVKFAQNGGHEKATRKTTKK